MPHGFLTKQSLFKLLLFFGSFCVVCLILVGLELVFRIKDPNYLDKISSDDINYLSTFSDTLGWAHQKNFSQMELGQMVHINSRGLRGKEIPYEKPKNTFRILMLGDSITYGYGVADNQTFSAYLANKDQKLEVINAGVQGYGTDQELIYLQNEGLKYHPDLIVLNFSMTNDFADNSVSKSIYDKTYPKPYFILKNNELIKHDENLKLNPITRFIFILSEKSILFNKMLLAVKINNLKFNQHLLKGSPNAIVNKELTYRLIQEVANTAKAKNIPFLMTVFTGKSNYDENTDDFQQFANSETLGGIPTIYINRSLKDEGYGIDRYNEIASDDIMHLTPHGSQVVADIFFTYISQLPAFTAAR